MTALELEQVIRDQLLDMYNKQYIGKIYVEKLEPIGYSIKLGLDTPEAPLVIYAELPDEKFLKFLKQELWTKRFNLKDYGKLWLTYPYDCEPRNTACECRKKS